MDKLIKIVYFDEDSAMDYINIIDGGKIDSEQEISNGSETGAKLSIGAKIASNLKFLNFFETGAGIESNAELVSQSKDIVKSTITNTILTDFIKKVNKSDSMVKSFTNVSIKILKDSFTHMKIFTPYTFILSENSEINKDIAVNKLDNTMEKIKGYYEFLVDNNNGKYVFRFNIGCLRNNYKLTDLMKMDLCYYGVKVGRVLTENLTTDRELNIDDKLCEVTAEDIANKILDNVGVEKNEERDIYDIILAGVNYNDGQ